MKLFCKTCLAKGHYCEAREGSDECIFCEDGKPCPVMLRTPQSAQKSRGCEVCGRPLLAINTTGRCYEHPLASADKSEHSTQRKIGKELSMEQVKKHKRASTRKCICGCGATVYGRWPYLKGHGPGVSTKSAAILMLVPKRPPGGFVAQAERKMRSNGHGKGNVRQPEADAVFTMCVREDWLDKIWARLSPEEKAEALAGS